MNRVFFIVCIIIFGFISCQEDDPNESLLNSFISLETENDTIFTGQSTSIVATVDGKNVKFTWSATAGDLLGSGDTVTYVAPPCTPGKNTVSCKATGSNKSETKTLVITVF